MPAGQTGQQGPLMPLERAADGFFRGVCVSSHDEHLCLAIAKSAFRAWPGRGEFCRRARPRRARRARRKIRSAGVLPRPFRTGSLRGEEPEKFYQDVCSSRAAHIAGLAGGDGVCSKGSGGASWQCPADAGGQGRPLLLVPPADQSRRAQVQRSRPARSCSVRGAP